MWCFLKPIMSDGVFSLMCVFQPIRVCVLGAPAVGKSLVCEHLCQRYKLHHISLKEVVSETISQLVSPPPKRTLWAARLQAFRTPFARSQEKVVSDPHVDAADEDALEEAQALLDSLRASLKTGTCFHVWKPQPKAPRR